MWTHADGDSMCKPDQRPRGGSILTVLARCAAAVVLLMPVPPAGAAAQSQNPSPMVETTRSHERLEQLQLDGTARSIPGPADREVRLFVPGSFSAGQPATLVVHFHGAAWIVEQAVATLGMNAVSAVLNLGAGSGAYDRAFSSRRSLEVLVDSIEKAVSEVAGTPVRMGSVVLSAFSAGHGAVRSIFRDPAGFARVDAVLLLDGMHTSYVPEGRVMAEGGRLDESNLVGYAHFARAAVAGSRRFLITHSAIFPGTYASTTETADWLLGQVDIGRTPVLTWGPRGMQQLSEAVSGGFELQGYAGNSAPDHVDHLHAMPELLKRLLRQGSQ
jgi:hypothetical protein